MKTFYFTILFLLFCTYNTKLSFCQKKNKQIEEKQITSLNKGNVVYSLGMAVPSIIREYLKYKTDRDQIVIKGTGPFLIKSELMLSNRVGVSLNGSYTWAQISWQDDGYDTIQNIYRKFEFGVRAYEISGIVRGNYHYWKRKKIDSYVGLGVGYALINMSSYTKAHTTKFKIVYDFPPPLSFECTWGLRYFPLKNLGIYTEVGLGKSWLLFNKYFIPEALVQAGICIKH